MAVLGAMPTSWTLARERPDAKTIKVFVPRPAGQHGPVDAVQRLALKPYASETADLHGSTGYPDWLAERWAALTPFINLEWDVLPWPGALEDLWDCPEPWCGYGYEPGERHAYLGCMKFAPVFMLATLGLWEDVRPHHRWDQCDGHLHREAETAGVVCHVHQPAVLHANPRMWRRPSRIVDPRGEQ